MQSKSYAALAPDKLSSLDPNSSYARIRELVGSGKRVLDVGCGPGNLAVVLRAAGNAVVGVDKDDSALVSASRVCERTFAADLDAVELGDVVGDEQFDVVVFADVLEHLRNPVQLLGSSRRVLRDGGCAIVSIPNVAHGAVRLALLRGRFEYQQLGILDDTHLRFYTRESVMRLLSEGGFTAVRVDRTTAPVFERSDLVPFVRREDYDAAVVADVLRDEDAETLQFVVRAAPVDEAQVVAVLAAEITSLQQAVRTLRAQLAQARDATAAHANGAQAERLVEVEQHYRNQLAMAEAARAERDGAVAAVERATAELERLRGEAAARDAEAAGTAEARSALERVHAELARRDQDLAAAAERARAELETFQTELAARDAAIAASAAELDALRARHDAAATELESLRDVLLRVQQLADALTAERDAALARAAAAADESAQANAAAAHANAAVAESQETLRATRALVAEVERELNAARDDAAALRTANDALEAEAAQARAARDEAAARADAAHAELAAAQSAERASRDRIAVLQAALSHSAPERRALRRRAVELENLLAVERTTREHVEEASDRILAVARDREARAAQSDLRRLLARSAVVEMELRLAASAVHREPVVAVPRPVTTPPALVLHAATVGRRTLTVLPPAAGRRDRLRAGWRRLRRLLPLVLLLAVGGAGCAHDGPVIGDAGPAFVRIGDDPSVYFLPARSGEYCLVAEPVQMKVFGGFERVKQYDAGARFADSRRLSGTCRYPDGIYSAGGTTYVLRGDAICREQAAAAKAATAVPPSAMLSVSRRDTGRCRSTG